MSFSFNVRAASIAAAMAAATAKMDEAARLQPTHAFDRDAVLANIQNQCGVIAKAAEGKHVVLYVSGSVSWQGIGPGTATPASDDFAITSAAVNVNAMAIPADADPEGKVYPKVEA